MGEESVNLPKENVGVIAEVEEVVPPQREETFTHRETIAGDRPHQEEREAQGQEPTRPEPQHPSKPETRQVDRSSTTLFLDQNRCNEKTTHAKEDVYSYPAVITKPLQEAITLKKLVVKNHQQDGEKADRVELRYLPERKFKFGQHDLMLPPCEIFYNDLKGLKEGSCVMNPLLVQTVMVKLALSGSAPIHLIIF